MSDQNANTAGDDFDFEAAAGLSDAEYQEALREPAGAGAGEYDLKAAAGLSDEEYLREGTVADGGNAAS